MIIQPGCVGRYAGHCGKEEINAYQRTVDFPGELANGFHVMLDTGELVTVRWDRLKARKRRVVLSLLLLRWFLSFLAGITATTVLKLLKKVFSAGLRQKV